jgi:hypothetical protein
MPGAGAGKAGGRRTREPDDPARRQPPGRMAEWFKAAGLKTSAGARGAGNCGKTWREKPRSNPSDDAAWMMDLRRSTADLDFTCFNSRARRNYPPTSAKHQKSKSPFLSHKGSAFRTTSLCRGRKASPSREFDPLGARRIRSFNLG